MAFILFIYFSFQKSQFVRRISWNSIYFRNWKCAHRHRRRRRHTANVIWQNWNAIAVSANAQHTQLACCFVSKAARDGIGGFTTSLWLRLKMSHAQWIQRPRTHNMVSTNLWVLYQIIRSNIGHKNVVAARRPSCGKWIRIIRENFGDCLRICPKIKLPRYVQRT